MMMVLVPGGVESRAEIAMTPLLSGSGAMGLLPNNIPPRFIFPRIEIAQDCSSQFGQRGAVTDIRANPRSNLDRENVIDRDQDDQQHNAEPEAPADQLFLDRQQRLDRRVDFVLEVRLRHGLSLSIDQLASGGLKPLKNSQEIKSPTQITNPNRLTK